MARSGGVILLLVSLFFSPFADARQTVLLVSIDGFRADYLDRGLTPTLSALAADGVRAAMRPSFPSLTFPNHYTLVTGLYPDHHGIVDNNMADPSLAHSVFSPSDHDAATDPAWWNEGVPLWVTVRRQGGHAATLFWPGSEVENHGIRPDRWLPYDQKMPDADRVDRLLSWLDAPAAERPDFLTLYFDKVDTAGHHQGPDSAGLNEALAIVDGAVARLIEGLKQRGLTDQVDLIVVADHGMMDLSPDRVIHIDDYIAADSARIVSWGAMMGIDLPVGGRTVIGKALLSPKSHMTCRRKQDMPARFHYGANPRVPDILCLADGGWYVTTRAEAAKKKEPYLATHGYDNQLPEMAALFIARGPDFKRGEVHAPFGNVDVYPLMARLLGVTPEANDGNFSDVADMLVTR